MNIPLFFVTALGLISALLLLFFNRGYKTANLFLAVSIILASLHHFFRYVALFSDWIDFAAAFITTSSFTLLILSPLMYFYVRSILLDNTRLSRIDYLHFLPFVIGFVGTIPYLLSSYDVKLLAASELLGLGGNNRITSVRLNIFYPNIFFGFIRTFQLIIYTIAIWRLMWVHHDRLFSANPRFSQLTVIKNWLLIVAIILTTYSFTSIAINTLGVTTMLKEDFLQNISLYVWLSSLSYVVLNFALFFYPQILYGLPIYTPHPKIGKVSGAAIAVKAPDVEIVPDAAGEKQVLSNLIPIFQEEYVEEIDQLMEGFTRSRKYLTQDLTIGILADDLNIPIHHLSFYLNNYIYTNFSDWRNSWRIAYAKDQIEEGVLDTITIKALGEQCGFATNNTFIRAFKRHAGFSPSAYAKSLET
jgi:AraC-like DNA-binding protein